MAFGWDDALIIGGTALASYLSSKGKKSTTTKTTRSSTPYKVKLPSGATVTMYAHGPSSTETTYNDSTSPWASAIGAAATGLNAYGAMSANAGSLPKVDQVVSNDTWNTSNWWDSMTGGKKNEISDGLIKL